MLDIESIKERFLEPFPIEVIKFRQQTKPSAQGYSLVTPYIDARDVAERLDEVVGINNWQMKHNPIFVSEKHMVIECSLGIRIGDDWIWKSDVGEGMNTEVAKTAYSDSKKRAGVAWGIGRFLYSGEKGFAKYKNVGIGSVLRWELEDDPNEVKRKMFPKIYGKEAIQKAKPKMSTDEGIVILTNTYIEKYCGKIDGNILDNTDIQIWHERFKDFHNNEANRKILHKPNAETLKRLGYIGKQYREGADIKFEISNILGMKKSLICLHPLLDNDKAFKKLCKVLKISSEY